MPTRRNLLLVPVLAALAAAANGCLALTGTQNAEPIAFDEAAALRSVNAFREANGLTRLSVDGRLTTAATAQAAAMAATAKLDHDVDGTLPRRLLRVGYDWGAAAENIGRGYADHDAAMRGWIDSPRHRRNLLNPAVKAVGFAAARDRRDGRPYWVQEFGAERERRPPPARAAGIPLIGGGSLRFP